MASHGLLAKISVGTSELGKNCRLGASGSFLASRGAPNQPADVSVVNDQDAP